MPDWIQAIYLYYDLDWDLNNLLLYCKNGRIGVRSKVYSKCTKFNLQEGINRMGKDW